MDDISIKTFLDMYRMSAVVAPLNSNTKDIGSQIKKQLNERVILIDEITDNIDADTIIIYETEKTDFSKLHHSHIMSLDHPPLKICIIIGFGTEPKKFSQLRFYDISLVYASFAEVPVSISLKIYPQTEMENNKQLMGYDQCQTEYCTRDKRSYTRGDKFVDLTVGIFHISSNLNIKFIKTIMEAGGEPVKQIFGYYNDKNKTEFENVQYYLEENMFTFNRLKDTANTFIIMKNGILTVVN